LLEVAYVTEFGLDADEQSALNFLDMIPTEAPQHGPLELLGDSDERYKILGGNQKIVDELARRLDGQIRLEHRLTRIASSAAGYDLSFDVAGAGPIEIRADIVILALPFTLLREVDIQVALPPVKTKAIRELGYGMCAKVMAGFDARPWRDQGFAGNIFSDEPFQLAWENSRLQPAAGPQAGITFYSGGAAALRAVSATPEEQAQRFMRSLEKAYPGSWARFNGKTARMDWPNYAWTKAAYACYRPGQWTTISGAEFLPVGNLHFAGEHCSPDFLGFMNGGAETGRRAAHNVMAALAGRTEFERKVA
jgi:monoamine oxidase